MRYNESEECRDQHSGEEMQEFVVGDSAEPCHSGIVDFDDCFHAICIRVKCTECDPPPPATADGAMPDAVLVYG